MRKVKRLKIISTTKITYYLAIIPDIFPGFAVLWGSLWEGDLIWKIPDNCTSFFSAIYIQTNRVIIVHSSMQKNSPFMTGKKLCQSTTPDVKTNQKPQRRREKSVWPSSPELRITIRIFLVYLVMKFDIR